MDDQLADEIDQPVDPVEIDPDRAVLRSPLPAWRLRSWRFVAASTAGAAATASIGSAGSATVGAAISLAATVGADRRGFGRERSASGAAAATATRSSDDLQLAIAVDEFEHARGSPPRLRSVVSSTRQAR